MATWRSGLAAVAQCPNVNLKLGGIGMPQLGFDWHTRARPIGSEELTSSIAPIMSCCIEQFSPNRCMFESNFPVDKVRLDRADRQGRQARTSGKREQKKRWFRNGQKWRAGERVMKADDTALLLRIYIGESERLDHHPLYQAIVMKARDRAPVRAQPAVVRGRGRRCGQWTRASARSEEVRFALRLAAWRRQSPTNPVSEAEIP